jgi:hypothetical protein
VASELREILPGSLIVTFWRGSEERDRRIARDGSRALKTALLMLASLDSLEPGDMLTRRESGAEK